MSITDTRTPPTIKPAKVKDAKEIYQLARDIWFLHYPGLITIKQIEYMLEQKYTVNKIQELIYSQEDLWLKVSLNDTTQGFGHFQEEPSTFTVKLDRLYVHPRVQRYGCGNALIRFAGANYARLGFKKMWLQVNKGNNTAIKFYQNIGFKTTNEVVVDIGKGFVMDDFIMSKALN